jgi:hypothetical protein
MRRPCRSFTSFSSLTGCVFFRDRLLQILNEFCVCVQGRGVGVFIAHLRTEPRTKFERGGIVKLLGADAFYEDVSKAMRRLNGET